MRKILLLSVVALCCMAYSCGGEKNGHPFIMVRNNSNDTIVCVERYAGRIIHDDTLYYCPRFGSPLTSRIPPNSFAKIEPVAEVWEDDFKYLPFIQFFIVDDSIYHNVPCDTIQKYNMILHRYQLKLEDLQRMNWIIDYPPEIK
jgi:hypothetical protein